MSGHCCAAPPPPKADDGLSYRRILLVALVLNVAMFAVEIGAGISAGSLSLLADAVDFLGDAANYGLALYVLNRSLRWRAGTALLKAAAMLGFGAYVTSAALWRLWSGASPDPLTMGIVGVMALAVNLLVALLLYRHRTGDANMRAVWLCSRNDALGNLAIMAAAAGVFASGSALPDLLVAAVMGGLALHSGVVVARAALGELGIRRPV